MPDINVTVERVAGRSPTTHGFSRTGGSRGVEKRIYGNKGDNANIPTFASQIHETITEILGTTKVHPSGVGKKLLRTMPKASPLCPWLYAERISDLVGLGQWDKSTVVQPLGVEAFDEAAFYETYEMTIEYQQRPYLLCGDDEIDDTGTVTWILPDGTTKSGAALGYANEWLRYTDVDRVPQGEFITAQAGRFVFDVPGNAVIDLTKAGDGQIKMMLQREALKITWFEVPYEYIHHGTVKSYISQVIGHVNQNAWFGFDAGSLLLLGCGITRYTPPVPVAAFQNGTTIYDNKKLCDIQFIMTFQDPDRTEAPAAAVNANAIQAGHNLMPFAHTGGWYFAKTVDVPGFAFASDRPVFPSAPFEVLFTNPGV